MPFEKGNKYAFKEGNQASKGKGRPKGALSINDELRKLLKQKDDKGRAYIETLARQIFAEALKGNERLIVELWQQIDGKASQNLNVGGQEDNPIKIEFEYVTPKIDE